ncbi:hypothetical protein MY55_17230 [Chromobacterium subtsugae]|nr:hypothetical protein MY55_17230 [Chromobacterium subtsugae]
MSFGFMVSNRNGGIVVSDRTYSMVYVGLAEFSGVTGAALPVYPGREDIAKCGTTMCYYVNNCPFEPLPFIRRNAGWAGIVGVQPAGLNRWEITVVVYPANPPQILVFCRTPNTGPAGRWGMVLRGPDGSLRYDSNRQNLVLADILNHAPGGIYPWESMWNCTTVTPLRVNNPNLAFCYSATGKATTDNNYWSYYFLLVARLSDAGFETKYSTIAKGAQVSAGYYDHVPQAVMVIDASLYI